MPRKATPSPPREIDASLTVLEETPLLEMRRHEEAARAKAARRLTRRVTRRRYLRFSQHAKAVEQLRPLPKRGESVHGVIPGTFSGWSLVTAAAELAAEPVEQLILCTLGFNRANCESLVELLDAGTVRRVLLNVSDYFRHSDRTIFAEIQAALEERGQRVVVTRSHAKLFLLQTAKRHLVIEASVNLRSSQSWEQFVLSDDAQLFAFHRDWIESLAPEAPCPAKA